MKHGCSHVSLVLVLRLVEVDLSDLGVIPLLISSRGSSINISKDEGSLGFRPSAAYEEGGDHLDPNLVSCPW
jgi:hypothetical protein